MLILMNSAHLHLILNHIPVLGTWFGLLLLLAAGVLRKSEELKRAALVTFVLTALVTIPTYLAGQAAEDMVERLPGVSEQLIEGHEGAGLVALIAASALGALALGGLILFRRAENLPKRFVALSLIVSLGVAGWMVWTANLGGKVRHTEIRGEGLTESPADEEGDEDRGGRGRGRGRSDR